MAWIESHQSLAQHPKTKKLARLLNAPLPQVIGHLHMLWWWAFDYAQDGDLSRYSAEDIADAVLWEGSASLLMTALLDSRFLDQPDGKPCIHDWDQYGGKMVAKRKADAIRKEIARKGGGDPKDVPILSSGHPADIQRTAQVEERRGEEKREEESSCAPEARPTPRRKISDADIASWSEEYPQVDIPAMVADYLNWSGSSKHTDKVLGFRNQLREEWRREKFRRNVNGRQIYREEGIFAGSD